MNRASRLALPVGMVIAASAATCNWCPAARAGVVVLPLAVEVHVLASLDKLDAEGIVKTATGLLESGDWASDVACQVELSLLSHGPLEGGPDVVNSQLDFDALFSSGSTAPPPPFAWPPPARQVRIVSEIRWCGPLIANAAGCSDEPGFRIVLARRPAILEGILWAHEVGHTKGLQHRSSTAAVMHPSILPGHDELTSGECTAYRQ